MRFLFSATFLLHYTSLHRFNAEDNKILQSTLHGAHWAAVNVGGLIMVRKEGWLVEIPYQV